MTDEATGAATDPNPHGNHRDQMPCLLHEKEIRGLKEWKADVSSRVAKLEEGLGTTTAEAAAANKSAMIAAQAARDAKKASEESRDISKRVFDEFGNVRSDIRKYQRTQNKTCGLLHSGVDDRLRNVEAKTRDLDGQVREQMSSAVTQEETSGVMHIGDPELLAMKYDAKSRELSKVSDRLSKLELDYTASESARKAEKKTLEETKSKAEDQAAKLAQQEVQLRTARYGLYGAVATAIIAGVFAAVVAYIQFHGG